MIQVPMIQASRTLSAAPSLSATLVRRRHRPLMLAPPAAYLPSDIAPTKRNSRWSGWRDDLRFFVGCYAAGLAFFLIMLS
jgi:hypothetical protein